MISAETMASESVADIADGRLWCEAVRPQFRGVIGRTLVFDIPSRTLEKTYHVTYDWMARSFGCDCQHVHWERERLLRREIEEMRPCHHIEMLRQSINWS